MNRMLIACAILAALPAAAQEPLRQPAEYTLTVSPQDIQTIGLALDELPAKIANPLARRLQAQIDAQNQAANRRPEPAPAAPEAKQ